MRLYPKKGALIVPVADGEAEHVVSARQLVETQSVRVVSVRPHAREALVAALRANLIEQREIADRGDVAAFSAIDADFHKMIVAAGGNPLLDSFYRESARQATTDDSPVDLTGPRPTLAASLPITPRLPTSSTQAMPTDTTLPSSHTMRQVHGLGFEGTL